MADDAYLRGGCRRFRPLYRPVGSAFVRGGEGFVARSRSLAGSAGELHAAWRVGCRAGRRRDGHRLTRPKLPPPIVAPAWHGGVAVGFQFRLDGLDLGARHELPAHHQHGAAEVAVLTIRWHLVASCCWAGACCWHSVISCCVLLPLASGRPATRAANQARRPVQRRLNCWSRLSAWRRSSARSCRRSNWTT